MFAPVWQTMPAISMEYQRALKRKPHVIVIQKEWNVLNSQNSPTY